ncbi:MAG: AsmA family protein [Pseudomonadota bacterium]
MKLLKRIFLTLLILTVLVVAAPFVAISLLDPNDVKAELASRLSAVTGREVAITGDVKLTAYPWLGAEVGALSIGNADGFAPAQFLTLQSANVRVQLMPLLQREVRMDTVTIDGLQLELARDAAGRSNWDDLTQPSTPSETSDAQPLAALALGGIKLSNATIRWRDEGARQDVTVSALDATTGAIDLARPEVQLDLKGDVTSRAPAFGARVAFSGLLNFDEPAQVAAAQGLQLTLSARGDGVGGTISTRFSGNVRYALATGAVTVDTFALDQLELDSFGTRARLSGKARSFTANAATGALTIDGLEASASELALAGGLNGTLNVAANVSVAEGAVTANLDALKASGALSGGPVGQGSLPFELDGSLQFNQDRQTVVLPGLKLALNNFDVDQSKGSLNVNGDLAIGLADLQLTSPALTVSGAVSGRVARGGSANVALKTALNASLGTGQTQLTGLRLALTKLDSMGLRGSIGITGNVTSNASTGTVSVKKLKVRPKLTGSTLPEGKLDGTLDLDAVANLGKQSVKLSRFASAFYGVKTTGSANVSGLGGAASVSGAVSVAPFAPRALMAKLNVPVPKTADKNALKRASLKAKFNATPKRLKLTPLTLKLDDSTLRGNLTINNFARPAYVFNLALNGINLNRYLPPGKAKSATPGAAASAAATLPLDTLRSLNASGSLKVGSLRFAKLRVSKADIKLSAKNGKVALSPVSALLYKGGYRGNINLDATGKVARLSFNERLDKVDAGALLTALNGKPAVTGRANAQAQLTTTGNNGDQLLRALNGKAAFNIANGTIRSVDIVRTICNVVEGAAGGETRFDAMTGTARVVNGVIENDALNVSSPLLRIGARGTADLPRDRLDYRGEVALVGTCKGQGGRVRGKLNGIDIPIRITGSLSDPKPSLDTSRVVESLARREIERKASRVTEKLQEKVGAEAGKALGGAAKQLTEGLLKGLLGN